MPKRSWKTKSSRVVYKNNWISVREDQVIRPDGNPGLYGVVDIRPSVCVVALSDRNEVALVGQWRYSVDRYSWELPRGGSHAGESDMMAVAKRELEEEAGIIAAHWQDLGAHDICNGVANDVQTFFVATGLCPTSQQLDPEEQDIAVKWVPFEEAVNMALDGRITEVCSVAALLKLEILRRSK